MSLWVVMYSTLMFLKTIECMNLISPHFSSFGMVWTNKSSTICAQYLINSMSRHINASKQDCKQTNCIMVDSNLHHYRVTLENTTTMTTYRSGNQPRSSDCTAREIKRVDVCGWSTCSAAKLWLNIVWHRFRCLWFWMMIMITGLYLNQYEPKPICSMPRNSKEKC